MTAQMIFDSGLQPERTNLAWRRTALSLCIGSIVSLRLLPSVLDDVLWFEPGIAGVVFAAWMWWVAAYRYRAFLANLNPSRPEPLLGGARPLFSLTLFAVAMGALALCIVLGGSWRA